MGRLGGAIGGTALLIVLAACSASHATSSGATTSSPVDLPTFPRVLEPPPTSTTVVPRPSIVGGLPGHPIVIPDGFAVAGPGNGDVINGPFDPAALDKVANEPGAAAKLGFVTGYDESFDQTDGNDSLELTLLQFSGATQATTFMQIVLSSRSSLGVSARFSAIPGAVAFDYSAPDANGYREYDVFATKGTILMAVTYDTAPDGYADQLTSIAIAQYQRL